MMSIELIESVLAVVGVVALRLALFVAVIFALAIPVAIVVRTAEAIGRCVQRARAARVADAAAAPAKAVR